MSFYLYAITNDVNDKVYVGQTENPARRWKYHTDLGRYKNAKRRQRIQSAMLKYGTDKFHFEIMGEFRSQQEVDDAEIAAIACHAQPLTRCTYNIAPGGSKGGGGPASDEARRKISIALKGKRFSEERKKKISEAAKLRTPESRANVLRYTKNKSQETRNKIAAALRGRKQPPEHGQKVHNWWSSLPESEKQERIAKLRAARKPRDAESIAKIAAFHTGRKRSPETCHKISAKRLEYWARVRAGEIERPPPPPSPKGKTLSKETRSRMSEAQLRRYRNKK